MTIRTIGCTLVLLAGSAWAAFGQENATAERPQAQVSIFRDSLRLIHCDTPPLFRKDDIRTFRKWVNEQVRNVRVVIGCPPFPPRVVVSFVIDTTGRLTDIRILQTPDSSLSAEAVRALKSSPRWKPGELNGRKVPVKIVLPVDFGTSN